MSDQVEALESQTITLDPSIDPALYAKQAELEERMTTLGVERYEAAVSRAISTGTESSTRYGLGLVKALTIELGQAITQFIGEARSGKGGRRHNSVQFIEQLDPDTAAMITLQHLFNGISRERPLTPVLLEIGRAIEDEVRYQGIRQHDKRLYQNLQAAAKKRSSLHNKRTLVVHVARKVGLDWTPWATDVKLRVGEKLVDLALSVSDVFEIGTAKLPGKKDTTKVLLPTEQSKAWVNQRRENDGLLTPVYLPMIVPPLPWSDVYTGGYLTRYVRSLRMVKTHLRNTLDEINNTEMPLVYEAVNHLQNTAWAVNSELLDIMNEVYQSGGTWAGIPDGREIEIPVKPVDIDTNEEARTEWRRAAARVHSDNKLARGERSNFNSIRYMAEELRGYDRIFIPYTLDFRGRAYAATALSPQGRDSTKALLHFADGVALGDDGYKWLCIHGANLCGVDKVDFQARVDFIEENEAEILAIAEDPINNRGWAYGFGGNGKVDKPWQFLAFCLEFAKLVRHCDEGGDVGEFKSRIPVALDGSCSGIQHYSMALKDPVGGRAVNIIPAELPSDIYQLVANEVVAALEEEARRVVAAHSQDGQDGGKAAAAVAFAKQWLAFGVSRKVVKRPVMTFPYGAGTFGYRHQILEDTLKPAQKAHEKDPSVVFPFEEDGYHAAGYLAEKITEALPKVVTKSAEGMKYLRGVAKVLSKAGLPIRWQTPLGFTVIQANFKDNTKRVDTMLGGVRVQLNINHPNEKVARELDPVAQANAVAPNFIHSLDAAHLQLTVVRAAQRGIMEFAVVHDSFGTHAGKTEELFSVVRESMVELYSSLDVFRDFEDQQREQLDERGIEELDKVSLDLFPESGSLDISVLLDSPYAFA